MGKPMRAVCATILVLLMSVAILVGFAPPVDAVLKVWTSDTDWNEPGAVFTATEVVGTGAAAKVDLLRDQIDWKNNNPPAPTPGTIESQSMTFIPYDNVTLLFGGYNGAYLDKTWEYDQALNTWTEITTTPKPTGRQSAGLSYDPVENVAVLFGGIDLDGNFRTDTWTYDPASNTWTNVTPVSSPPSLVDFALVYHASASRHILYGQNLMTANMETWAYDATANTWTNRAPSNPMSGRSGYAMAYHPGRDRTVLFGGAFFMTFYDETWEYNYASNSWNNVGVAGPSGRAAHAMTYRGSFNAVLLFGGITGSGTSAETWAYSAVGVWTLQPSITMPSARKYTALAHDTKNDVTVLYGGSDPGGTRLGDTWSLGAAYRAAGKYASPVFNAGGGALWGSLWWNKTPANQPAATFLRFQIATSTSSGGPWNYVGPDGTVTSYYGWGPYPVGTNISASPHDGKQYLRFLADFGSTNTQVTPSMEDVTIEFWIPPLPPCVVSTDPADLTFGVPQNKVVRITFSESINTGSFSYTYQLPTTGSNPVLTPIWGPGNTYVDLTHAQPFQEAKAHRLLIAATDVEGNPLAATCPGGGPAAANPFTFVTEAVYPYIVRTTPAFDEGATTDGYPLAGPIIVEFSEGMDTASPVWNVVPNVPGNFTPAWSAGDSIMTLNHGTPLANCTRYEVQIWASDKAGLDIIPGPVPNPWHFYSYCEFPFLISTDPSNLGMDVPQSSPIVLDFSRSMLTSSVSVVITPTISLSQTWTMSDRRLTLTHTANFPTCTVYRVSVSGTDLAGKPLIQNPKNPAVVNPWRFMTFCDNPSMMITIPADGDVDVPVLQDIIVAFSDEMNTASVTWMISPPVIEMTPQWNANVMLTIPHFPFNQCTRYTVQITAGRSLTGLSLVPGFAANPWSFDTVCTGPYVTDTNPAHNQGLVPVDQVVWVNFSEPMDTTSLFVSIFPSGVTFTPTWSNGDQTLRLDHATPFLDCQPYTISVDGLDKSGESMLLGASSPGAPNPWNFTTRCIVPFPYLVQTNPANMQQNVPLVAPIILDFSEAINTGTFQITTNPGGIAFTPAWSLGNTRVTLSHSTSYTECDWYATTVSFFDLDGNKNDNVTGSPPNPWQFRAQCVAPWIVTTSPANGATNVPVASPIVVTFSEAMLTSSVTWNTVPTIALTPSWSGGNTVLTLSHTAAFQMLTLYTVTIATGTDVDGVPLTAGPVPNPWSFTTGGGLPPPTGLKVERSAGFPPADITLRWQPVGGAASYRVYSSIGRFAAWPWPILQDNVAGTSFTAGGHGNDGSPHYYIVRAKDSVGTLSANSTMGAKIHLAFSYSSVRSNVQWMSFPYRTIYGKASDITSELTSARIDVVGKWNPATQSSVLYYWFRGAWRGTDFAIAPGDGVFIGVRSAFTWVINGTDGDVSHLFQFYPPPNAGIHWFSMGYTHVYQTASAVVRDIEGGITGSDNTFITEIARWDPLTQQLVRYFWQPTGWTGTDFSLVTGEGIYFKVVSTFPWAPSLLTPEVP